MKRLGYPQFSWFSKEKACSSLFYVGVGTLCFWLLYGSCNLYAQNSAVHVSQLAHTAWRLREGAVPGAPNALAQTKDGYVWLGTENGLYRFDGESFKLVEANEGHIIRVQSLLADRDGSLWVGAGRSLYHYRQGVLRKLPGVHKVLQMFQASSGDIWISTENFIQAPACRVRSGDPRLPAGTWHERGRLLHRE